MYGSDWIVLMAVLGVFVGCIVGVVLLCLGADTSSWSTYHDHGKYCITRTYNENNVFSSDKTYVDNWCK